MSTVQIGIIGGSGLYDMAELTDREERVVQTPFGDPSGPYVVATLRGRRVAFLARHGHGHRLVAHVAFAHPLCQTLSDILAGAAGRAGATVHRGGTYVCMEGPQFSTI